MGETELFWDILDKPRKDILPLFESLKNDFYLAGGTALALQLGHRDSIDFDFFTERSFSTTDLSMKIVELFRGHKITKIQEETNTLTVLVDDGIKISFFSYPYELIHPLIDNDYFKISSMEDIGCMKLSAVTSRSALKDYVDLYFIFQAIDLKGLLVLSNEKFPTLDSNLILKSLVYFDDIIDEPIMFKHHREVSKETIRKYLTDIVKSYLG